MRGCVHLRVPSCLQMARGREARLSPMHTQVGTGMSCSWTRTPRLSDIPGGSSLGRRGRDDAGGEVSGNTVGGACPSPGLGGRGRDPAGRSPPSPAPSQREVGGDRAALSTPCIRGGLPRALHTAAPAVTGCAPSRSLCPPPSISPHGVCPILFVWHNG